MEPGNETPSPRAVAGVLAASVLLLVGLYLAVRPAVGPLMLYLALVLLLWGWRDQRWARGLLLVGTLFLTLWLLWSTRSVLTPFAVALVLAYLLDPVIRWLGRRGVPRNVAIPLLLAVVALAGAAVLVGVVPLLIEQIGMFSDNLPGYADRLMGFLYGSIIPWLNRLGLDVSPNMVTDALISGPEGGLTVQRVLGGALEVTSGIYGVLAQLLNLILIPVVTFYLLRDWDPLVTWADGMVPPRYRHRLHDLGGEIGRAVGDFLRGQLVVSLVIGALFTVGLTLAGIPYALLLGLAAAVLSLIPYVGSVLTFVLAALVALLGPGPLVGLLKVAAVYAVIQVLDGTFITPTIMGERTGLHPVVVMLAVLLGAALLGFVGLLVAVPLTAVLRILVGRLLARYRRGPLFDEVPSSDPPITGPQTKEGPGPEPAGEASA